MKQRVLLGSFLAGALLAPSLARADRVDYYIKGEMDTHRIPGVALVIIQNGKTVKTAAYGLANLELNVPVKPEKRLRDRLHYQAVHGGGHPAARAGRQAFRGRQDLPRTSRTSPAPGRTSPSGTC